MTSHSPGWRSALRALVERVPRDEIPDLIGELARAKALVETRLRAPAPTTGATSDGDAILNVQEVADHIGMSSKWVYNHADELGGFKVGSALKFSARGIRKYITTQRRRT